MFTDQMAVRGGYSMSITYDPDDDKSEQKTPAKTSVLGLLPLRSIAGNAALVLMKTWKGQDISRNLTAQGPEDPGKSEIKGIDDLIDQSDQH
jgi:hypothetical protein